MRQRRAISLSDGEVFYDVFGSDRTDEDENDDDDLDDDDDTDDDSDDDDGDETDDDDSQKGKRKTRAQLEAELAEATEAADRATRRMKRADRRASKAVNDLNALKQGGAKELADAQAKITELEAKLAEKSGTDTKSIVREEFRDSDLFNWHNRKLAFELLDLDEVDVDDDGNVDGDSLQDAIKKLAKEHPYLVKTESSSDSDDDDEDEDDEDDEKPKPKRTGASMNSRKRPNQQKSQAQISKKFPIIQGRF